MKRLKLLPLSAFVSAVLYGTSFSVQAACLDTTQSVTGKAVYSNQACISVDTGNALEINATNVTDANQGQILIRSDISAVNGTALLLKENVTLRNNVYIGSGVKDTLTDASLSGRIGLNFQGTQYQGFEKEETWNNGIIIREGNSITGTEAAIKIKNGPDTTSRGGLPIRSYSGKINGNIIVENPGSRPVNIYFFPNVNMKPNESKIFNTIQANTIQGVNLIKNQSGSVLLIKTGANGSNWGNAEFLSLADSTLSFETNVAAAKSAPLLTVKNADIQNPEVKVTFNDLLDPDVKNNAKTLSGGNEITFTLLAGTINSLGSNAVKLFDANNTDLSFAEKSEPFNAHSYINLVTNGSTTTSKLEGEQYQVTYKYEGGKRLDINAGAGNSAKIDSTVINDIQSTNDLKSINNTGNLEIDLANGSNINWSNLTFNSGSANDKLAFNITGVDENTNANFTSALLSAAKANIQNSTLTLKLSDYTYDEANSSNVLQGFNGVQLLALTDTTNSTVGVNSIAVEDSAGKSLIAADDTALADNIISTHKSGALNLTSDYKFSYSADSYELTLDNTQNTSPIPRLTSDIQSQMKGKNYTSVTNKGDAIIDVLSSGVNFDNASFSSANAASTLTLSVADKNISEALLKAASVNIANQKLVIEFAQSGVTTQDIANKDYVIFEGINGVSIDNATEFDLVDNKGNSLLQLSDEVYAAQGSWQVANHKAGNLDKGLQGNRYQIRYTPGQVEFLPQDSRNAFASLLSEEQKPFIQYILDNKLDGTGSEADKLIRSAYTNAQAKQLANEMMPDISGADINSAWVWGEQMRTHIENRTLAYRHQLPSYEREDGWNLWAASSLAHGSGGNGYDYSLNRYGVHIGMDRQINDEALIGLSAGMNRSSISPSNGSINKKLTQLTFMPYVEWKGDLYFAGANLIGGTYSVDSERKIGDSTATGNYTGFQFGYQLTTGIDTELKGFNLRPFVSLKQQWFGNEGWEESGSPLSLTANTQTYNVRHAGIGVSLWKRFDLSIGKFVPSLDLQYYRQLGGSDYDVNYRLVGDTTEVTKGKFTINNATGNQFSTKLNASLNITETLNLSSSLSYNKFGNYKETAFGLSLSNTF